MTAVFIILIKPQAQAQLQAVPREAAQDRARKLTAEESAQAL